jgi:hypothetical protein
LQNRLIQTSQTGGEQYNDTSHISIPWFVIGKIFKADKKSETLKMFRLPMPSLDKLDPFQRFFRLA